MGLKNESGRRALTPIAFAISLTLSTSAHPANILVDGGCDIVDAITAANANSATGGCIAGDDVGGFDTITLPASTTFTLNTAAHMVDSGDGLGTLEPDSALPLITSNITIQGGGATIQRGNVMDQFRILHVASTGSLSLTNLTLSNGYANGRRSSTKSGGAILNYSGSVRLFDVTLSGNTANRRGGGIHSRGPLEIDDSVITNNFSGSEGGGVGVGFNGSLNLQNSQVNNNSSSGAGGGLQSYAAAGNTIYNTTINGNSAGETFGSGGGASLFNTDLDISESSVSNNSAASRAGGMQIFEGSSATLNNVIITDTNFSNNGGAEGLLSQVSTNIYGGSFNDNGGTGLELNNAGIVQDVTVNNNAGQYGMRIGGANMQISNAIVSNNSGRGATIGGVDVAPFTLTSSSFNMNGNGGLGAYNGTLTDVIIDNNMDGGGLGGSKVILNDVTVSNNTHTNVNGVGGIRGFGVSIYNSSVTGNVTTNNVGGGVYLSGADPNIIRETYIAYNTAASGGGVFVRQSNLTLEDSNLVSNDAGRGGAVYGTNAEITVTESTLASNRASQSGGGVYMRSGSLMLARSSITGNSATQNGGGIINQGATVSVNNSTFFSNRATNGGGAVFADSNTYSTDISNSTLYANSAAFGGGLLTSNSGPMLSISGSVIAGSSGSDCYNQPVDGSGNWFEDASCNGSALGSPMLSAVMTNLSGEVFFNPLPNSGLIDGALECELEIDQNNQPRSICKCDIGAIEIPEANPDNDSCRSSFFVVPTKNGRTVIFEL